MSSLNKLLKKDHHHLVLMVLLALFIVLDVKIPEPVAELVDTLVGKIVVVVTALSICATKQPVLSALALVAAYELIKRSEGHSLEGVKQFIPSEAKKLMHLDAINSANKYPVTIEEEMVAKMVPSEIVPILSQPSYTPGQCKLHGAAKLN
tara:strand:+ start:56 stop:505 length:450 start_codon:yes stop_codon:yes gene_type:complete